jgi:hypothetical protein
MIMADGEWQIAGWGRKGKEAALSAKQRPLRQFGAKIFGKWTNRRVASRIRETPSIWDLGF